jgi:hypothetical protein
MAIMLAKTYAAFKAAGVSESEATAAVIKWMLGVLIAGVAALLIKAFA